MGWFSDTPDAVTGKALLFLLVFSVFWLVANAFDKSEGRQKIIVVFIAGILAFISTIAIPDDIVLAIIAEYSFIVAFILMVIPIALLVGIFALMHLVHKSYGDSKVTAGLGFGFCILALVLSGFISNTLWNLADTSGTPSFMIEPVMGFMNIFGIIQIIIAAYAIYFGLQVLSGGGKSHGPGLGSKLGGAMHKLTNIKHKAENIDRAEISAEDRLIGGMYSDEKAQLAELHMLTSLRDQLHDHTLPKVQNPITNVDNHKTEIQKIKTFKDGLRQRYNAISKLTAKEGRGMHRLHRLMKRELGVDKKVIKLEEHQKKFLAENVGDAVHLLQNNERAELDYFEAAEHAINHTIEKEHEHLQKLDGFIKNHLEHLLTEYNSYIQHSGDSRDSNTLWNLIVKIGHELDSLIHESNELTKMENHCADILKHLRAASIHEGQDEARAVDSTTRGRRPGLGDTGFNGENRGRH